MKKIFFIFVFFVLFAFTTLSVYASSNYLQNITIEKNNDSGYNIVLAIDRQAKISKKIININEILINIKGVTSADTVNAIYKGTDSIENLVVENSAPNNIKIYVSATNIASSSIFARTSDGLTRIAGESFPIDKALWSAFVLALVCVIFVISKKISEEEDKILIKKDIKEREIELYKHYKRSLEQNMDLSLRRDMRMREIQKKIDRKIDERLMSSIK